MFTSLLFAAYYLGHLAGYLVGGIPYSLVAELTALLLPAMAVKTFSMAMLLSSLLAFGRLSSDSEIVALRAGGASLYRIISSVAVVSFLVALLTFSFDEVVVPAASQKAVDIENEVAHIKTGGAYPPGVFPVVQNQKLVLTISAAHVNRATNELDDVAIDVYDGQEHPDKVMTAPVVKWAGITHPTQFYIPENARIESLKEPFAVADFQGPIWPGNIPDIGMTFGALITVKDNDYDSVSMVQLADKIREHRLKKDKNAHDMADYEYGFWNKISVPLAALVFGCLGAVLGIRNHRTGTATGFALAVAIIFGYFMLASFMSVWALGGAIPAWVASFSPLAIGIVATVVIMKRRNS